MNTVFSHLKKIILRAHAPGLGDWLIYTVLAKLFRDAGYEFWISTKPIPGFVNAAGNPCAFRNEEIRELLWERNPYVSGFTEEEPNVPHLFGDLRYIKLAKQIGAIPAVEVLYGFVSSGATVPVIFYEPKLISDLRETTVMDPSAISQPVAPEVYVDYAAWASRWHDLGPKYLCVISKHSGPIVPPKSFPFHTVQDIFEYCDILFSSQANLMTESGGHVLSASLRSDGTFSCTTTMAFNDRIFVFPEHIVQYYITGRMTPDFHSYPPGEVII